MKAITFTACAGVIFLSACTPSLTSQNHSILLTKQEPESLALRSGDTLNKQDAIVYNAKPNSLSSFNVLKYIVEVAKHKREDWLKAESKVPPFALVKPVKKVFLEPERQLVKSEFETTESFIKRVTDANQAREKRRRQLEADYQQALDQYNRSFKAHQQQVVKEREQRLQASHDVYLGYIKEGIQNILGVPTIKRAIYDADLEVFYAELKSDISSFRENVVINVPINVAPKFKNNIVYAMPEIDFNFNDEEESLQINTISVVFEGKSYPATIDDRRISLTQSN